MSAGELHGNTIEIDLKGQGKVTFELVRLGTIKEFETVKAALAAEREHLAKCDAENSDLIAQRDSTRAKLLETSTAYADEKEKTGRLEGELATAKAESSRRYDCHGGPGMSEPACGACVACLTRVIEEKDDELISLRNAVAAKDIELDNLMQVKASIEETSRALEVRDKELCESNAALVSLKTELLGDCTTFLDTLSAKLSDGEAETLLP